jgi:two-component system nitrogen regulation response regulator GlnG
MKKADDGPGREAMTIKRILVADDEESIRWVLSKALSKQGYQVDLANNGQQALEMIRQKGYDLAVLDIKMPGMSGLDLLTRLQEESPATLVVIMTAESSMKNAVEAMKRGAYDYITKPFDLDTLDAIILKAQKAAEVNDEVTRLKDELKEHYQLDRTIIGQSPPMQALYKVLGKVAPADVTVLITGESGTGKELVARAIHFNSPRLGKPFLALNCAAIPRELLESELFGHEKGAFTGAAERKTGKFEQANGGTLFLDEIGDMPLELQAKLLRVLQEREITRTGGTATIRVDVRIIAATNQNLKQKVQDRVFREDLYYRLNVVPIELPPLRQRREDIPALVEYFLGRARDEYQTNARGVTPQAMDLLTAASWPGNIRELEHALQRASLLSPDALLSPADFPELLGEHAAAENNSSLEGLITAKLQSSLMQIDLQEINNLYDMVLHQMERPLINIVLDKTRGNQVRAAEVLGINRNTLRKKIQLLGINPRRS